MLSLHVLDQLLRLLIKTSGSAPNGVDDCTMRCLAQIFRCNGLGLEALGLNLDRAAAKAEETLDELGIAFLFAANHPPALRALAPIRKRIGRRTIFNLTGPLANPARVTRQMIGVARPELVPGYAEAAQLVGIERVAVVCGGRSEDRHSAFGC